MITTSDVKTQVCSCCGQQKPLSEFYKQSYTGIPTLQCKVCINVKRGVVRHKQRHTKFVAKERQRNMEDVDYSIKDWQECMVHFHGECAYCGVSEGRAKAAKFDRDHIIALSKGGKTTKRNIIPACPKCNRSRGNKDWKVWYLTSPNYSKARAEAIDNWIHGSDD